MHPALGTVDSVSTVVCINCVLDQQFTVCTVYCIQCTVLFAPVLQYPTKALAPLMIEDYRKVVVERRGEKESDHYTLDQIRESINRGAPHHSTVLCSIVQYTLDQICESTNRDTHPRSAVRCTILQHTNLQFCAVARHILRYPRTSTEVLYRTERTLFPPGVHHCSLKREVLPGLAMACCFHVCTRPACLCACLCSDCCGYPPDHPSKRQADPATILRWPCEMLAALLLQYYCIALQVCIRMHTAMSL